MIALCPNCPRGWKWEEFAGSGRRERVGAGLDACHCHPGMNQERWLKKLAKIGERVGRIADAALVEVMREYPDANQAAARETARTWLLRAAERLHER